MTSTITDIARAAGVGESTVVRALRGTGYVSAKTRARVLQIASELNYQPNQMARGLRLGKSGYVTIVSWYMQSHVWQSAFEKAEQDVRDAGYSLLFHFTTRNDADAERSIVDELLNKRVAGAVISPAANMPDRAQFQRLLDADIKLVVMDKIIDGLATPHVVVDQYTSGRLAAEHLISLGHRDIAYLAMPEDSPVGRQRAAGFRDALRANGVPVPESSVVVTELTEECGASAAVELLKRRNRPTAIVARHDVVAIGAMQAILDAGLTIPGDVSVVGHSAVWPSHALRVPLTTVRAPVDLMASLAVEKLLQLLAGKPARQETTLLGVELVVRASTGPCRE